MRTKKNTVKIRMSVQEVVTYEKEIRMKKEEYESLRKELEEHKDPSRKLMSDYMNVVDAKEFDYQNYSIQIKEE
jgi:predicted RNase H-like nuclease (RuvC/YqgF family)